MTVSYKYSLRSSEKRNHLRHLLISPIIPIILLIILLLIVGEVHVCITIGMLDLSKLSDWKQSMRMNSAIESCKQGWTLLHKWRQQNNSTDFKPFWINGHKTEMQCFNAYHGCIGCRCSCWKEWTRCCCKSRCSCTGCSLQWVRTYISNNANNQKTLHCTLSAGYKSD